MNLIQKVKEKIGGGSTGVEDDENLSLLYDKFDRMGKFLEILRNSAKESIGSLQKNCIENDKAAKSISEQVMNDLRDCFVIQDIVEKFFDLQSIIMNNSLSSLMNDLQNGFTKPLMKEKNEDAAVKYLIDERKKYLSELEQCKRHGIPQSDPRFSKSRDGFQTTSQQLTDRLLSANESRSQSLSGAVLSFVEVQGNFFREIAELYSGLSDQLQQSKLKISNKGTQQKGTPQPSAKSPATPAPATPAKQPQQQTTQSQSTPISKQPSGSQQQTGTPSQATQQQQQQQQPPQQTNKPPVQVKLFDDFDDFGSTSGPTGSNAPPPSNSQQASGFDDLLGFGSSPSSTPQTPNKQANQSNPKPTNSFFDDFESGPVSNNNNNTPKPSQSTGNNFFDQWETPATSSPAPQKTNPPPSNKTTNDAFDFSNFSVPSTPSKAAPNLPPKQPTPQPSTPQKTPPSSGQQGSTPQKPPVASATSQMRSQSTPASPVPQHQEPGKPSSAPNSPPTESSAESAIRLMREQEEQARILQDARLEQHSDITSKIEKWTAGKKGNLRSLLSTFHEILWEDSGWTQVPLNELLTESGVKKAQRKAMLVVHPDKMSSRPLEQQLLAERIFEILKEAK